MPAIGQGTHLPIAKNGKWGLIDEVGNYSLKPKYDYIEFSEAAEKYIYQLRGKQGLIDKDGTKLLNLEFTEIKCLNGEFIAVRNGKKWKLLQNNAFVKDEKYDSISFAGENLFLFYNGKETTLYNTESKASFTSNFRSAEWLFDDLVLITYQPDLFAIFSVTNFNLIVDSLKDYSILDEKYICAISADSSHIINIKKEKVEWEVPGHAAAMGSNYFYSKTADVSILYDLESELEYSFPEVDEVLSINTNQVKYREKGLVGVWNFKTNKEVLPAEYETVLNYGNFWFVSHFNQCGMFSSNGKKLIPVEFDNIEEYTQCFKVEKNGLFGVYSMSGRELEPPKYSEVRVYNSSAKCTKNKQLTLLNFDSDGSLTDRKVFTDFMTISIEKPEIPRRKFDAVNFSDDANKGAKQYGWYQPVKRRLVNGDTLESRGKWGLKNSEDSILVRPRFGSIDIIDSAGFTKAYGKDINALIGRGADLTYDLLGITKKLGEVKAICYPKFILIDHFTGKKIGKSAFLALNHYDFLKGELARGYIKSAILVNKLGETIWEDLTFSSGYKEGIMSICQGGNIVFRKYNFRYEGEVAATFIFNLGVAGVRLENDQRFMKVNKGSWYYINSVGKQLNQKPFQYGGRFKNASAIVKINNKWGVVDTSMNFLIPPEYDVIERVEFNDSSYFRVGVKTNENYIYSRVSGELEVTKIEIFDQYYNGLWRCKLKDNNYWGLIDTNFNIVAEPIYTRVYPFKNGLAEVILKRSRTLLDTDGNNVIPFYKAKKIKQVGDLYSIQTKKGVLLINSQADTVINELDCKGVLEVSDDYALYLDRNKVKRILLRTSNTIVDEKLMVHSVSFADHLALVKKGSKKKLLNLKTSKFEKLKANNIVDLGENVLVYRNNANLFGLMTLSGDSITKPIYKDIETYKGGWSLLKEKKFYQLMSVNKKLNKQMHIYRLIPLGNSFKILAGKGKGILSQDGKIVIEPIYSGVELLNNMFYKVTDSDGKRILFDLEGQKITEAAYDDYKAVSTSGMVAEHDKFDYLYTSLLDKSLSFQKMDPFSSEFFMLNEGFKVGLINAEGKELLPTKYHKIEKKGDFWQIRFFNSFGFAKQNGELINDPL